MMKLKIIFNFRKGPINVKNIICKCQKHQKQFLVEQKCNSASHFKTTLRALASSSLETE